MSQAKAVGLRGAARQGDAPPQSDAADAARPQLGAMSGAFGQAWADPKAASADAAAEADAVPTQEEVALREALANRAPHEKVLQDEAANPLEFAALAKLRVWESGAEDKYSLEEVMKMVRWLEGRLDAPARPRPSDPLAGWRGQKRAALALSLAAAGFALLVLVGVFTALLIQGHRVASAAGASAALTVPLDGGRQAGAGAAVHFHELLQYPSLPFQDLRRVQDVAFRHRGAFYFFRIASASKLMDGGVRLVAEDGSLLRVTAARVTLERPFEPARTIPAAELEADAAGAAGAGSAGAAAGALRVLAPYDDGGLRVLAP